MKSTVNRLFLFAAAALSLGTAAYGQETLTATVPFAFHVAAGNASAGRYNIQIGASGYTAEVRDRATGRGVITFTNRLDYQGRAAIAPRLVFRCGETGCRLTEIWTLTGGFSVPVQHVRAPEYTVSIPFAIAGD